MGLNPFFFRRILTNQKSRVYILRPPLLSDTLMPGPCGVFQSVNNFGNRLYPKEKSTAWPLLFWIEYVTRLKRTSWTRHECSLLSHLQIMHDVRQYWHRCSTCPLLLGCCKLSHTFFSQTEKERTACKVEQIHKKTTMYFHSKGQPRTILSKNSYRFVNLLS